MTGNLVIQIDGRRWFGELLTNDEMDGTSCLGSCCRGVNQVGVRCTVVTRRPNSALDALRLVGELILCDGNYRYGALRKLGWSEF